MFLYIYLKFGNTIKYMCIRFVNPINRYFTYIPCVFVYVHNVFADATERNKKSGSENRLESHFDQRQSHTYVYRKVKKKGWIHTLPLKYIRTLEWMDRQIVRWIDTKVFEEREREELRTAIQALILLENVKSGLKMPHKQTIHLFAEQKQRKMSPSKTAAVPVQS